MAVGDIPIIRLCEVLSNEDNEGCNRIKVRLLPEDSGLDLPDIPFCIPLLPKTFFITPKVGEMVIVMNAIANNANTQRFYIGPIISQLTNIEKENYNLGATSMFFGKTITPKKFDKEKYRGLFPQTEDIALLGRNNSDIQLKRNELLARCGFKRDSLTNEFNTKSPAYIKMKFYNGGLDNDLNTNSVVTVVGDKINLIGNNSSDFFQTRDKDEMVTDDTIKEILEKAHQLPYGDKLCEVLALMIRTFIQHTHPISTLPPCATEDYTTLLSKTENVLKKDLLSNTVRIN